jgi:type IV pilus assembly protein PilB
MPPAAFSQLLGTEGIVSAEQLAEAMRVAGSSGKKMHDEVVRLGYAPAEKVMKALAKVHRLKFVNLAELSVPEEIIQLLPESVARETTIFSI